MVVYPTLGACLNLCSAVAVAVVLGGCDGAPKPAPKAEVAPDPKSGVCPSDESVEALHTAVLHFEAGQSQRGRDALARARKALPPTAERDTDVIVSMLVEIAEFSDAQLQTQRVAAEPIRAKLHDWACLPDALHEKLHVALDAHADGPTSP